MKYTGINAKDVKETNRISILNLINDRGAISRKDIAEELGITAATVTLISADMLAAGILCEKGEVKDKKRAGRRKILLDINYQYKFVLCICIEVEITTITISDLSGTVIKKRQFDTDGNINPKEFLKHIAVESKALMWESDIRKENILGAGVSLPGIVSREEGISRHAYRIWNEPVAVKDILEKYLDCPIIVENNVTAFAEGELTYGNGKAYDNILFIKWGPGVGSALIIDGKIYNSKKSGAAEIGHCIVKKNGELCRCGKKGCLETVVSTHAMAERVREVFDMYKTPELFEKMSGDINKIRAKNVAEWITSKDIALKNILEEIADMMTMMIVNFQTFLVPEKVVVYGYMFDLEPVYEKFIASYKKYAMQEQFEKFIKSSLGSKADYIGALAVVMNEIFLNSI